MENFGKLPQISGVCPIVKFCPNPGKTDLEAFGGPSQQKNRTYCTSARNYHFRDFYMHFERKHDPDIWQNSCEFSSLKLSLQIFVYHNV